MRKNEYKFSGKEKKELKEERLDDVSGGKGDSITTEIDLFRGRGSTVTDGKAEQMLKMLVLQGKITPQEYNENIGKFRKK